MDISSDRHIEFIGSLGFLADMAEYFARDGKSDAVKIMAGRIYERAFKEYVVLNGEGDMGELFLDWANDYERGGPIYSELVDIAESNSWKQS